MAGNRSTSSIIRIFSAEEKIILIGLVKEYEILHDKRNDVVTLSKKRAAWEEIERRFNSNDAVSKRTLVQLRKCWDNFKSKRKKELRDLMNTGGGPVHKISPIPVQEQAVPNVGHSVEFWCNSDGAAVRPPSDLFTIPVEIMPDTAAAASSATAQGQSCAESFNDAPAEEAHPSSPQPPVKKRLTRQSILEEEVEARLRKHKQQMQCDMKLQLLKQQELQFLVEVARQKLDNTKEEEDRRKQAFHWEEERKRKLFEAEERRKEEIHVLKLKSMTK